MCFKWCLIDKAQLLISSEMNGKQLGKPTRQGRTPRAVASFLLQNSPNPSWQKQGRALLPPSWGWSPLSPPSAPPGVPAITGVQPCPAGSSRISEPPAWRRYSAESRLRARLPNTRQPGHSRRCCSPREGEQSWLDPRCPSPGPAAGTEPVIAGRAKCDPRGQTRCGQGQAVLLGTGAEHQGWAQLCRWHVRAGAGRPRCQAGLAASWHGREAAGSESSGHHPGAGERHQGDRPSSTLVPFTPCDEPPTACHNAGCPQGNGSFPSSCWAPQHEGQGMGRR